MKCVQRLRDRSMRCRCWDMPCTFLRFAQTVLKRESRLLIKVRDVPQIYMDDTDKEIRKQAQRTGAEAETIACLFLSTALASCPCFLIFFVCGSFGLIEFIFCFRN